jgi:hypothetical protein
MYLYVYVRIYTHTLIFTINKTTIINIFTTFIFTCTDSKTSTSSLALVCKQLPHTRYFGVHEVQKLGGNLLSTKEKLSLGLSKYHAMKTYTLLNQALHHEDVWGSGGLAPRILNVGSRWRCVVSLTLQRLYPQQNSPRYALNRKLDGPQIRIGRDGKEKNSHNLPEVEPRSSSPKPSRYIV